MDVLGVIFIAIKNKASGAPQVNQILSKNNKLIASRLRSSSLNTEHEIILPHEIYEKASDFITRDIIKTCDLMIAEVSYTATGLGIELGWADAYKCPIICIYQKDKKVSGSLKVVTDKFIKYTDKEDMINKLNNELKK